MIKTIVKTIHNVIYLIPVILVFTVYLFVQILKGNKVDEQNCRTYLTDNWVVIDFIALLFWSTIIILTIKIFA